MKKGIFLPLVLFFLLVLAMLGIMFNRNSQTEFRQAYFTSDMMRAHMIAEAALEEALAETRAKLNNEFRDKFINGGKLSISLQYSKDLKSDIISLEDGATTNPVSYSVSVKAECTNIKSLNDCDDKLGTLVFEVNCSVNKVRRDIRTSYDYKVVDVRPVGNEYCFMVENASNNNGFNMGPEFYTDARKSKGISIGGSGISVNLDKHYNVKGDWDGIDLHSDKNSEKSLIPGGRKEIHLNNPEDVMNNEPFENSTSGNNGNSNVAKTYAGQDQVPGSFEHTDSGSSCTAPVMFPNQLSGLGYFAFATGYKGGNSKTHFFGKNCKTASGVEILGDVKKRYTVYCQKWQNVGNHNCDPKCICSIAFCPSYNNEADWDITDQWKVGIWKKEVLAEYLTSESKYKSNALKFNNKINYKGEFKDYKEVATRYIDNFPGEIKDTFISNGNLFLEGLIACNNGNLQVQKYKTPGILVAENKIEVSGNIQKGEKANYGSDFFKQDNVIGVMAFNDLKNDNSPKKGMGFFAKNKFESSNMNINGNLVVQQMSNKNFGGELIFDTELSSKNFCVDSGKSNVISLSPIPSSYIVLNN